MIGLIGVFIPVIPAVVAIWLGFILYHFFISSTVLGLYFWIAMALFTLLLFGADLVTNSYFVKKFGGSKSSQWGAIAGVLIGTFLYPPFGMILIPIVLVFILEIAQQREPKEAAYASVGAVAGFLSGAIAKLFIQFMMIIWFIITII